MGVPVNRSEFAKPAPEEPTSVVTSHTPRPGKRVFTERDNCDGWIASTYVVDLEP